MLEAKSLEETPSEKLKSKVSESTLTKTPTKKKDKKPATPKK